MEIQQTKNYPQEFAEILMVDDSSDDVALFLREIRKKNINQVIHICEDGEEAISYLNQKLLANGGAAARKIKVVFLDLKLPKVNGFEVLQAFRNQKPTMKIPVVILSSSQIKNDIEQAYLLGASSYVVKPVDFQQYSTVINALIEYWLKINEVS